MREEQNEIRKDAAEDSRADSSPRRNQGTSSLACPRDSRDRGAGARGLKLCDVTKNDTVTFYLTHDQHYPIFIADHRYDGSMLLENLVLRVGPHLPGT